jgi:transcription-repair coupling factor (superfamily II helicase)
VPEVETLAGELRDRYGPVPDSVLNLLEYGRIRVRADALGVETIDREGHAVVIRFRPDAPVDPTRIVALVEQQPGARLIPPVTLTLDLGEPPVPSGRRGAPRPQRGGVPGRRTSSDVRESWWTARATAGEVRPGFTRGEMLRPPPERPREADGLFVRLGRVLDQLSQRTG